MKGRLNLFQAAMVRWREMHPYNAVHVVTLQQPFDLPRLEACIRRQLEAFGLAGIMLDRRRLRYEWTGTAAEVSVAVLAAGADPQGVMHAEIERQLNLAFPAAGRFEPFRFFVVLGSPTIISSAAATRSCGCCGAWSRIMAESFPRVLRYRAPIPTRQDTDTCLHVRRCRWRGACRLGASSSSVAAARAVRLIPRTATDTTGSSSPVSRPRIRRDSRAPRARGK
jgi:hypothetical protein